MKENFRQRGGVIEIDRGSKGEMDRKRWRKGAARVSENKNDNQWSTPQSSDSIEAQLNPTNRISWAVTPLAQCSLKIIALQ